jgi:hypothetical protein
VTLTGTRSQTTTTLSADKPGPVGLAFEACAASHCTDEVIVAL